jgi:hypothetical protein
MGFIDQYRQIARWRQVVYAICTLGVFGLVIWDIFVQSAQYSSLLVIGLLVIAIAVRPGGLRGPLRR